MMSFVRTTDLEHQTRVQRRTNRRRSVSKFKYQTIACVIRLNWEFSAPLPIAQTLPVHFNHQSHTSSLITQFPRSVFNCPTRSFSILSINSHFFSASYSLQIFEFYESSILSSIFSITRVSSYYVQSQFLFSIKRFSISGSH